MFSSSRIADAEREIADLKYSRKHFEVLFDQLREDNRVLRSELSNLRKFLGLITDHLGVNLVHVDSHWKIETKGGPERGR